MAAVGIAQCEDVWFLSRWTYQSVFRFSPSLFHGLNQHELI